MSVIIFATDHELATSARMHYGMEMQLRCIQEEAAELIVAISHHLRPNRPDSGTGEIAEEAADLIVLLAQLADFLGPGALDQPIYRSEDKLRKKLEAKP